MEKQKIKFDVVDIDELDEDKTRSRKKFVQINGYELLRQRRESIMNEYKKNFKYYESNRAYDFFNSLAKVYKHLHKLVSKEVSYILKLTRFFITPKPDLVKIVKKINKNEYYVVKNPRKKAIVETHVIYEDFRKNTDFYTVRKDEVKKDEIDKIYNKFVRKNIKKIKKE
jgi:hypothetical protein